MHGGRMSCHIVDQCKPLHAKRNGGECEYPPRVVEAEQALFPGVLESVIGDLQRLGYHPLLGTTHPAGADYITHR